MRIAAHVLAYNVGRFIRPVLGNMAQFVDKIYVAYPAKPFSYVPGARASKINPTSRAEILASGLGPKLEIIDGDWLDEESMRNACLDRARDDGFDWLITQDADEFYPEENWLAARHALLRSRGAEHFSTTWYNFWKSSDYVLLDARGSIKQVNAGFALRCRPGLRFTRKRLTNAAVTGILDHPCYHYGYVMSDAEMLEKVSTWSHAGDFDAARWYRNKWLNWTPATRNLHPTDPVSWQQAIRFPLAQPRFAAEFALPVFPRNRLSAVQRMGAVLGDARASMHDDARRLKRRLCGKFRGMTGPS